MNPSDKKDTQEIRFLKLQFEQVVRSLEHVKEQLCHARDDSYHRARAEAKNEAYENIIREFIQETLIRPRDES